MSADTVHPSAIGANTKPALGSAPDDHVQHVDDQSLPPQRHAGAAGLGPNYPLGPSLGDKLEGIVEEIKGKVLHKPELVEHGREHRTGELMRKEREQSDAVDPFKASHAEAK